MKRQLRVLPSNLFEILINIVADLGCATHRLQRIWMGRGMLSIVLMVEGIQSATSETTTSQGTYQLQSSVQLVIDPDNGTHIVYTND